MNSPKINVKIELVDYVYRVYTKKVGAETILDDWSDTSDMIKDIIKKYEDYKERKYCMPEGINSKEEHEQYLQAIGYEEYLKELAEIYSDIPNSKDCKTIVEAYLVEKLEKLKNILER